MNIYMMRHGLAEAPGQGRSRKDSERSLTRKGTRKTWDCAAGMERLGLSFDLVLSSPYVRARQTAEIICEAFNLRKKLELTNELAPARDSRKLVEDLAKRAPANVLLVGHEPSLSELISLLVSGDRTPVLVLKKGGLCKLKAEALHYGRCCALEWLLTPKQIAAMA